MKNNIDESYYLFKELEKANHKTQRALAKEMGMSVGKINFVLKALINKGFVKFENFSRSNQKSHYRYILTTKGITEKVRITKEFIHRKEAEWDEIQREIQQAKQMIE